ncbi:ATP-binding cassette domain-containing protein [bacterium]|nr:ATP-binding cassette domain-containing protein [bacterium]RQV94348.1 MAG: ATP-binding cassette domain-containing protein [bacterium]
MDILKVDQVSKSFGDVHAVKDLSFFVKERQVFGLLGPNGAGKTTMIRMIMQILLPDRGSIHIFEKPLSPDILDEIGYLPEERGLFPKMKVIDTVTFFGEIHGIGHSESVRRADTLLKRLELYEWRDKKVEELSRGMQQKLQFICTILHKPKLLILDEPFTGLDPVNTNLLKDVMVELKGEGTTIIFSTHLMEQVEKLCESICLINKGEAILSGSLREVKSKFGKNRVRLSYEGKADFLKDKTLVDQYDDYGQYVEIGLAKNRTSKELLQKAIDTVTLHQFEMAEPSLNEIFITVVKAEGGSLE